MSEIEMEDVPKGTSVDTIRLQPALEGKKILSINIEGTTAYITIDDGGANSAQQNKKLHVSLERPARLTFIRDK